MRTRRCLVLATAAFLVACGGIVVSNTTRDAGGSSGTGGVVANAGAGGGVTSGGAGGGMTTGGAGGTGAVGPSGGSAGATDGGPGCGGGPCGCVGSSCGSQWATWPMPNPASAGLPNPASYDTSTPGVVVDNVTGLMWQQGFDSSQLDQAGATAYCAALTLAGYSDWRLPTEIEGYSLVDYTQWDPAIDTTAFPDTPADFFWSSSPAPSDAWIIYYGDYWSYTGFSYVSDAHWVRCVRGGPSPSGSHYTIANGTVKDNFTGLVWQRVADENGYTYVQARTNCQNLALAGGGWRMPSVKELMTLVDYTASAGPTLDTKAFPNAVTDAFWSSTPVPSSATNAWYVDFYQGDTDSSGYGSQHPVRCVR